jgi:NDP-sugar pyrophosphorylase family protein
MRGAEALAMRHVLVVDPARPICCPKALRIRSVSQLPEIVRGKAALRAGIIAAGDGSRLRQSHPGIVKPLVPVHGRPLCHWIVSGLMEAGVRDVTVLLNSRGRQVQDSVRTAFPSLRFTFIEKDTASSWESFRLVARELAAADSDFLISTVDAVIPSAEVARFAGSARAAGAPAALALTGFIDDEKPLWADLGPDGRVIALGSGALTRQHATCGLYYLTAETARAMPEASKHTALRQYLQVLVAAGRTAGVVLSKTIDVDRPEDVRQAEEFLTGPNAGA